MEERLTEVLAQLGAACEDNFGTHLVGVYVHGSLALGCFLWEKSDVDFLVVTDELPTQDTKERFLARLLEIDRSGPPKGLEMSVVLEKDCRNFSYPTPFSLHFSHGHLQECEEHLKEYCGYMNGTDPDLAAHFTILRHAGIALCGKPIAEVFGEVPREAYLDSIRGDIEDAREDIQTDPMYVTLTLCRVLAYQWDGLVLSKRQGGEWGLNSLPEKYAGLLKAALEAYGGARELTLTEEQRGLLPVFADDLLGRIYQN